MFLLNKSLNSEIFFLIISSSEYSGAAYSWCAKDFSFCDISFGVKIELKCQPPSLIIWMLLFL